MRQNYKQKLIVCISRSKKCFWAYPNPSKSLTKYQKGLLMGSNWKQRDMAILSKQRLTAFMRMLNENQTQANRGILLKLNSILWITISEKIFSFHNQSCNSRLFQNHLFRVCRCSSQVYFFFFFYPGLFYYIFGLIFVVLQGYF